MEVKLNKMKLGKNLKRESLLSKDDRKASQGFVDVKSKTIEELEELIERQDKLLQNRGFIAKLPDKGGKILSFKSMLEAELEKRQKEFDSTCKLFSNLTLNEATPEEIEWNEGKLNKTHEALDSDDESDGEVDPLRLIARHSGTAKGKTVKMNLSEHSVEKTYINKFCEKYGEATKPKERFKPNQLKDNNKNVFAVSAEKVKQRLGDRWEVTEATPPVPVFKDTMIISLSESLQLQKEQAERLKELEKKIATEKLIKSLSVKMGEKLPVNNISEYRGKNAFDETAGESEEDEVVDSEEEDKGGTVYFPVENNDS